MTGQITRVYSLQFHTIGNRLEDIVRTQCMSFRPYLVILVITERPTLSLSPSRICHARHHHIISCIYGPSSEGSSHVYIARISYLFCSSVSGRSIDHSGQYRTSSLSPTSSFPSLDSWLTAFINLLEITRFMMPFPF